MYTAPKRRAGVGASFRVHKLWPRSRTSPGPQIRDARYLHWNTLRQVACLRTRRRSVLLQYIARVRVRACDHADHVKHLQHRLLGKLRYHGPTSPLGTTSSPKGVASGVGPLISKTIRKG